jgi:hypothetical protein
VVPVGTATVRSSARSGAWGAAAWRRAVTAGTIARQCLELGLLDAIAVDLVPVGTGQGRPFFG